MLGAVAKNTIKTVGLLGGRIITQAISLILLSRLLGAELYGGFIAIATLAIVMGTLPNLGAGYLMMSLKVKREDAVTFIWRFAWPLTLLVGSILLTIYYFITLELLIGEQIQSTLLSNHLILLLGISELILMPIVVLLSFALQANNKVPLSQLVQWLPLLFRLFAIVLCFFYIKNAPLYSYIVLQFFAVLLALIIAFLVVTRHIRLDWRPRLPKLAELSSGAKYASMGLSNLTASEIDKILVVNWLNNAEASIYSATSRVVSSIITPVTAMLLSAQPKLFQHANIHNQQYRKLVRMLFWLTCLWGLLSWLILTLAAPYIASLFGEGFNTMTDIMPLLAFVSLPFALRRTAGIVLASMGRPLLRVSIELLGMMLFVVFIIVLSSQWGLIGFIASVLLSEISMSLLLWLIIYKKLPKVS